ncbi:hypothetical protein THIOKS1810003 [Thiocapsa sp. KS1]|nr:hypothetical protein [Thiocapsa sp. KS1]CRI67785.1 hypothetical protein THIOKS1810003 [Thiocapsa sp. KS1]
MTADFQTLRYQFLNQWSQIEQADPADRRILVVELAKALADWEAAQAEPLEKLVNLKRNAHWSALAQTAAAASGEIAERLGEEKQTLRDRLRETQARIQDAESQLQTLTPRVEEISAELALSESSLVDLTQRETALRQQLDACLRLSDLQSKVTGIKTELGLLGDRLRAGQDPAEVLSRLAGMRDTLGEYYDAYLSATRDISSQLSDDAAWSAAPPTPEVLDVPSRLLDLDRALKDIDRTLAGHQARQEALDLEIKARV